MRILLFVLFIALAFSAEANNKSNNAKTEALIKKLEREQMRKLRGLLVSMGYNCFKADSYVSVPKRKVFYLSCDNNSILYKIENKGDKFYVTAE